VINGSSTMEQAWQKYVPVRVAEFRWASFIQRFYRGGCAHVSLLGACLTLTGWCLMQERSRSPVRWFDRSGTEAGLFNMRATTQRTLGLALERLA
jgi:hypothetical protein